MKDKSVSIIIPVFNSKLYMEKCLNSLIEAVTDKIEILLVDDGSNDGSSYICDQYSSKYSYIKCIHQLNQGVSAARNTGLKNATGKYIMFIDSDDYVDPIWFSKMLSEIDDQYDCIASGIRYKYDYNEKDREYKLMNSIIQYPVEINNYFQVLNDNRFFSAIYSKIYKKSIIDKYSIRFPIEYSIWEDSAFVYEYLSYCKRILCVDYIFYNYRQALGESLVKRINKNGVEALLYRYVQSKYLIEYLNEQNRNKYYSTLGYWLIVSMLKPYLYNKNMYGFEKLKHYMNNSNAIEILNNSKDADFSVKEKLFFTLAKNGNSVLFHIMGLTAGKIKRAVACIIR